MDVSQWLNPLQYAAAPLAHMNMMSAMSHNLTARAESGRPPQMSLLDELHNPNYTFSNTPFYNHGLPVQAGPFNMAAVQSHPQHRPTPVPAQTVRI